MQLMAMAYTNMFTGMFSSMGAVGAAIGLLIVFVLLLVLAAYIYGSLALMKMAERTKTKDGWLAFVPVGNIYLMTQIAKVPGWWTIGILLAFIPMIGSVFVLILTTYLWWQIAERLKRPGWWALLMLIPIVNFVIIGIMAWGKK